MSFTLTEDQLQTCPHGSLDIAHWWPNGRCRCNPDRNAVYVHSEFGRVRIEGFASREVEVKKCDHDFGHYCDCPNPTRRERDPGIVIGVMLSGKMRDEPVAIPVTDLELWEPL